MTNKSQIIKLFAACNVLGYGPAFITQDTTEYKNALESLTVNVSTLYINIDNLIYDSSLCEGTSVSGWCLWVRMLYEWMVLMTTIESVCYFKKVFDIYLVIAH